MQCDVGRQLTLLHPYQLVNLLRISHVGRQAVFTGETDMLQTMQQVALDLHANASISTEITGREGKIITSKHNIGRVNMILFNDVIYTLLLWLVHEHPCYLMQEWKWEVGSGWQCIVGTHFGLFGTHYSGCFIYSQPCNFAS